MWLDRSQVAQHEQVQAEDHECHVPGALELVDRRHRLRAQLPGAERIRGTGLGQEARAATTKRLLKAAAKTAA